MSLCKGDLDGNAQVQFGDIDPFLSALFDPAEYAELFPGLEGSRVFHVDFAGGGESGDECNGAADFFDVDYFAERLFAEAECRCTEFCGHPDNECNTGFAGGGGSAPSVSQVAEALGSHACATNLDTLAAIMQEIGSSLPEPREAFWADVLTTLGYE